ncbi:MAG TPA: hypothetical protein VKG23_15695 [Thermoanaerobaculia bacterium]|nr:hypothetical protein [Thermoanaerobaculia bacterium]
MTRAARALADTLVASGAARVAFLGLAKNVGKTTALVAALEELHRLGLAAGVTSAGRDGESIDAITGEPKPRFRVWPGQWLASASSTYASASLPASLVERLPFSTRFGDVEVRRAEGDGEIEMIGPSTASQMRETAESLRRAGAEIVLVDGAIGRRAFAGAKIADGVVLSVGLAAGSDAAAVLLAARSAVELIRLDAPPADAEARPVDGALTDLALRDLAPRRGEILVADDFASVFLSPEDRRRLGDAGVRLAVRRRARLLAITVNPTAPARPPADAARFFASVRAAFPEVPAFDLVADLRSTEP